MDTFDDKDVALFFAEWCKNGLNAKRAYQKLHPDVTERSAETLGSRMLRKVEVSDVLAAHGLGIETYIDQLKQGLNAEKGLRRPDHKIRRIYHEVLGKLLKIERKEDTFQQIPEITWSKR